MTSVQKEETICHTVTTSCASPVNVTTQMFSYLRQQEETTIVILSILQQYEEHRLDGEASNAVVRYSILFYINWCKRCLDILSTHMCTLCNKLYCRSCYFGVIVHFQMSINLRESYPLVFQFIPMVTA